MIQRRCVIVYFEDKSVLDKLDKQSLNIYYVSNRDKYATIYVDANRYKPFTEQLKKTEGVIRFEDSLEEMEKTDF